MEIDTLARLQRDRDLLQEPPIVAASDLVNSGATASANATVGGKPKQPSAPPPALPARPTNAAAPLAAREPLPLLRERASWDRDASNPMNESLVAVQQLQQQRPIRPDIFVNPYPDAGSCVIGICLYLVFFIYLVRVAFKNSSIPLCLFFVVLRWLERYRIGAPRPLAFGFHSGQRGRRLDLSSPLFHQQH
jgi:hypothetical protein